MPGQCSFPNRYARRVIVGDDGSTSETKDLIRVFQKRFSGASLYIYGKKTKVFAWL